MRSFKSIRISDNADWYFDHMNDGIIVTDREGCVIYVNEAYLSIANLKRKDIVGYLLQEARPGAQLPKTLETGIKRINVYRDVRGTKSFVDLIPLFDNKHNVVGGLVVVKSHDEFEKLVQELEESNKKLEYTRSVLNETYNARYTFDDIIGKSMNKIVTDAKKAASSDISILLTGESGTGKGMIAEAIHNFSKRHNQPFVSINMSAIPSELIESELFGYEEGAFTGAKKTGKYGLLQIANGGTLFLDEIGDMPSALQAKLLKVLEDKKFRRIGSTEEINVDIRVIAATNKDLLKEIKEGHFRKDLYYRLAVFVINIPALRDRKDDIPILLHKLLEKYEKKKNHKINIDNAAQKILKSYDYPGNVRELQNCLEYSINVMHNYTITVKDLPNSIKIRNSNYLGEDVNNRSLKSLIKEFERRVIIQYMEKYGKSLTAKKEIANSLGISLASLYNKISKYKI